MEHIFFDNWQALFRTGLISILAYVSLITLLRLFGKRTLSKMNAFDLVVTVALGSTLATILLNKDVTLAQGVLALALLIGMQFVVTWSSLRVRWVRKLATGEPTMLLYQGTFLPVALGWTRVTEDEVRAAVRNAGAATLDEVKAVVLETDGSFSVVRRGGGSGESSLIGVNRPSGIPPPHTNR
ncbi:MAG: DUF421 domain-containing protein [Nitrospirales bacterium]|nr:DUF421 domain-containing protein [Nitrospira sp. MA-1]GJL66491.1 MAG: DUF421 domain-containing protein [Nitrospirales bacterium]HNP62000.1 DUF421 domain-containing protein [Nitrospirales bacterium]